MLGRFLKIARRKASVCDRIHTFSRSQSEHLPQLSQNPVRIHPSRCLKQFHPHRRCMLRRLRGQPQLCEDAGDSGWFFNGRDELQLPTTVRALFDVGIYTHLSPMGRMLAYNRETAPGHMLSSTNAIRYARKRTVRCIGQLRVPPLVAGNA